MSYQSEYSGAQVDEAVGKALNPDAAPTADSTNLVQSGGVASAVSAVMGSISHRNLIDNPFFTVNQRGFTSTSTNNTYTADRWLAQGLRTHGVISLANDVITIDATNAVGGAVTFAQSVDVAEVGQRPVTLSVMLANGDIISDSATIPARTASQQTVIEKLIGTTECYMRLYLLANGATTPYFVQFLVPIGATLAIKAVKLELGSVSTLATDAPPNFAEELAKCQRYAVAFGSDTYGVLGCGYSSGSTTVRILVPLPATMRAVPTFTMISGAIGKLTLRNSSATYAASAISSVDAYGTPSSVELAVTPASTVTAGVTFDCFLKDGAKCLFSADL